MWFVTLDGSGDFIDIQSAIDASAAGDTVLVAAGVYSGDGNRDLDFGGKPLLVIAESAYNPAVTEPTIIDCGGSGTELSKRSYTHFEWEGAALQSAISDQLTRRARDESDPRAEMESHTRSRDMMLSRLIDMRARRDMPERADVLSNTNDHRGFYFHSGENVMSIVDGFVIENGLAWSGGGILCDSISSPTIRNNTIRHCMAFIGGAICGRSSSPLIIGNDIGYNESFFNGMAAGISLINSSTKIENNEIHNNHYGDIAGGIYCEDCPSVTISGNRIYGNGAATTGGGIALYSSEAHIVNNDFVHNGCGAFFGAGGAIVAGGSILHLSDNEFDGNTSQYGGAIYCYYSRGYISNNTFHDNRAWWDSGGCILSHNCAYLLIADNEFRDNYGRDGAAVCCADTLCIVKSNLIANNHGNAISGGSFGLHIIDNVIAGNGGFYWGTIHCSSVSAIISGNSIASNYTSYAGGGIYCNSPDAKIVQNTIVGNAAARGAGVFCDTSSAAVVSNNIIAFNKLADYASPYDPGGGIYSSSQSLEVACCDLYENSGGNYIGIPDQTGVNGNISVDPLFCDYDNSKYTLNACSPCLPGNHPDGNDCGLIGAEGEGCDQVAALLRGYRATVRNSVVEITWTMFEMESESEFFILKAEVPGDTYKNIDAPDIVRNGLSFTFIDRVCKVGGTYRYRVDMQCNLGRTVLFETEAVAASAPSPALLRNYPNPCNPATAIGFSVPEASRVTVRIFDVSGRLVRTLTDGMRDAGTHEVVWNGRDDNGRNVSGGVYFYRLVAGSYTDTKKLVMVR